MSFEVSMNVSSCDCKTKKFFKVDFRSWGGGYTDTVRVREYFSQTNESRGNWHQGVYGYRTGWSVSVGNLFGIEGGRRYTGRKKFLFFSCF